MYKDHHKMKCFAFFFAVLSAASSPVEAKKAAVKPPDTIEVVKKVDAFLNQFSAADIQMAIVHASSQAPPDATAAACWGELRYIMPRAATEEAKLAYALQRLRAFVTHKKSIDKYCPKVLPQFVKIFDAATKTAK